MYVPLAEVANRHFLHANSKLDPNSKPYNQGADPHHFNFFYFNADLDPTFHFNANPENAPRQSNENLRPLKYDIQALQGSTLGLHASIVGVPDLPQLHLEPHKLLNPDPAHHKKINAHRC